MAIHWDDELQPGSTGWSPTLESRFTDTCGGVNWGSYDTVNKVSGTASLKLNFPVSLDCGGFTDKAFTSTTDLYSRFYIRLSSGFASNSVGTKLMYHSTQFIQSNFLAFMWGGRDISYTVQNYPTNGETRVFYPNVGSGDVPNNGSFYMIETRTKLNTVGQADGIIEFWKNSVQFMNYTGLEFRKVSQGTQNNTFTFVRLFRQHGLGSINYDRLAFGNTRIGPIGGEPPPPPATVPSAPTGLQVA